MTKRWVETQDAVTNWARQHGFVYATSVGNGRQGRDVLNTLGMAIEVKARADFSPLAWIKQVRATADGDLPFVVLRCPGQGPKAIDEWPVIIRLGDFAHVLEEAHYFPEGFKP